MALAELEATAQARRERDGLGAQAAMVRQRLDHEHTAVTAARECLDEEQRDVAKLESMSLARIVTGLKGSRSSDLDRERAEALAAEYAVAQIEARIARDEAELSSLTERIDAFGDLGLRHQQALVARAAEVRADARAGSAQERLTALAAELGETRALLEELTQADVAARGAAEALGEVAPLLGSARNWAMFDLMQGGFITSLVKYNRVDEASKLMRAADAALARLALELVDVGMDGVGNVGISETTRGLDIWFDNVFSDYSAKQRIQEAATRVYELRSAVRDARKGLEGRTNAALLRLVELEAERNRLLVEGV